MTTTERDELLLLMNKKLLNMDQTLNNVQQKVSGLENDVSGLKQEMAEQKAYTQRISESVAFLEVDHGDKLQALLDMFPEFVRKFESNKKRFASQDKRLENHTFRIIRIEDKIGIK